MIVSPIFWHSPSRDNNIPYSPTAPKLLFLPTKSPILFVYIERAKRFATRNRSVSIQRKTGFSQISAASAYSYGGQRKMASPALQKSLRQVFHPSRAQPIPHF